MSTLTEFPVLQAVFRKLGGQRTLGEAIGSEADLARVVRHRIPLKALEQVKRGGISESEIDRLVIRARTRRHRRARRERLTVEESDRLVRLTRIQALAEDVFGDATTANRWLREPLNVLDGQAPLDLADTDAGARVIEQILAKIDWGAAA
jgi:putative toxin-antitoxin system antitoxin component (TIGR02293 family)